MTKPTMELVEEYGEACQRLGYTAGTECGEIFVDRNLRDALLSEIRQRLEAMEQLRAAAVKLVARVRTLDLYDGSTGSVMLADELERLCDKVDAAMAEGEAKP